MSSLSAPLSSNLFCAAAIITSGWFTGCKSRNTMVWRRWYCARAVPSMDIEAPMIGRARHPVDRILEHAGDGIVVFRRHEQQRIGRAHLLAQRLDDGREALLADVLVVGRHLAQLVEAFDLDAVGRERDRRVQRHAIVRASAQAAAEGEDLRGHGTETAERPRRSAILCYQNLRFAPGSELPVHSSGPVR